MRLKTVSGDATVEDFAGQLVGNTVSGDLGFERVRLHGSEIVTVSGPKSSWPSATWKSEKVTGTLAAAAFAVSVPLNVLPEPDGV